MSHWNISTREPIENEKVDAFIESIIKLCKEHGFSISHEDGQGAFVIEEADEGNFDWLREASIGLSVRNPVS
jgi:hypothetical protein